MIMPVRQRCPVCREEFMGSDVLGRPCFQCQDLGKAVPSIQDLQNELTVLALVGAYRNASAGMMGEDMRAGHRSGVRDVAVRLGLYDKFCAAINQSN